MIDMSVNKILIKLNYPEKDSKGFLCHHAAQIKRGNDLFEIKSKKKSENQGIGEQNEK